MLRVRLLKKVNTQIWFRHISSTRYQLQNSTESNNTNPTAEDDNVESSVKERMIFGSIFEKMQEKDDLIKENISKLLDENSNSRNLINKGTNSFSELKVNFGKTDEEKQRIEPSDINLVEYFKKVGERNEISKGKKETSNDKTSIIYDLFENIEHSLLQNRKKALEKADALRIDIIAPKSATFRSSNLRIDVNKLEAEERYKIALENVMKPYVETLHTKIKSDYEIFEYIKDSINVFIERNKQHDSMINKPSIDIINSIKENCSVNTKEIPEPYVITIPYIIIHLLNSPNFDIPSERKYTIAMYVYQQCKSCMDLSLYLNMCNVNFYNVLLKLSWENFNDVHRLADLTSEMSINGIMGDIFTVEIMDKIVDDLENLHDEVPSEDMLRSLEEMKKTSNVIWSKDTRIDLSKLKKYLNHLKQVLTYSA